MIRMNACFVVMPGKPDLRDKHGMTMPLNDKALGVTAWTSRHERRRRLGTTKSGHDSKPRLKRSLVSSGSGPGERQRAPTCCAPRRRE